MGRKRKQAPPRSPPTAQEVYEQAQKFASSPATQKLGEQIRKFTESPNVQVLREQLRKFEQSPTARERMQKDYPTMPELREQMRRPQKIEAEKKRRPGGRPLGLTQEQIKAGIRLLSSCPKMEVKMAQAMLRQELRLGSVSDSALYRSIISKVWR